MVGRGQGETLTAAKHSLVWFAIADWRSARLFSCIRTPGICCHVEQLDRFVVACKGECEHRRVLPLGRDFDEAARCRFVPGLQRWLAAHTWAAPQGSLDAFVTPTLLSELRRTIGLSTMRLHLHEVDVMRFETCELVTHPAIAELTA